MEIPEERDVDQNDPEEKGDKEHEDEGEIPAEGKQNGWEKVLFLSTEGCRVVETSPFSIFVITIFVLI